MISDIIIVVVVLLYVLASSGLPHPARGDLPWLLLLGLVNTGLAYLLYFSGLQKLPAQSVALISYIDPVSALFFSAVFLHESMTTLQFLGAVLILGGAIWGSPTQLASSTGWKSTSPRKTATM